MRGILFAWMRQSENVELFKANQSPKHALHLKFDLHSGLANDFDYPHLQLDVVSLYLIFLANFIASGLDIIYCMDEVTFIQNLVYYVERAYRTPDYGNWEPINEFVSSTLRSNRLSNSSLNVSAQSIHHSNYHNQYPQQHQQQAQQQQNGQNYAHQASRPTTNLNHIYNNNVKSATLYGRSLEIHATSIGMAKSALEAINGCNLFGGKGANWSIIYSDVDAHSRNRSIFETMLPRESRSKNTDSYLLATISWPCFATHDPNLYDTTKSKILRKLKGKYGLKRFLRDSYGTVIESEPLDHTRSELGNTVEAVNMNLAHQQVPMSSQSCEFPGFGSDQNSKQQQSTTTTSTKQRKSSYFQRKNNLRMDRQYNQDSMTNDQQQIINSAHYSVLQRSDSTTKMSKRFENIESEWPLFICFLIIDGIFKQDLEQVKENEKLLYELLLKIDPKFGDYLMPKYYFVPLDSINDEKGHPESVERLASQEGSSSDQVYITGQAILLITRLLLANLVHPNELDPLRRHMPSHDRPKRIGRYPSFRAISSDLVVQVVLIAESIRLQAMMANYGIQTQTPLEVEPVQIWSSSQLVKVYEFLGVNAKLGLKGRPARPIGALGTSKLYRICGQTILCYPLIFEVSDFYLAQDMLLLIDDIQNELNFIGNYWRMSGRPTVCIIIREEHLKDLHFRDLLDLLVQFKNGKLKKSGLRIKTGRLQNLISSSCIEHLDFLHLLPHEHLPQFESFKQLVEAPKESLLTIASRAQSMSKRRYLCSASTNNVQVLDDNAHSGSENEDFGVFSDDHDNNNNNQNIHHSSNTSSGGGFDEYQLLNSSFRSMNSNDLDESYSTIPQKSIDYHECFKDAPIWPDVVDTYRNCTELDGQSQLLALIWEREGGKCMIDDMNVEDRLERLSQAACLVRNWSVVRYCSSVLKRSVESLSPWLTSILVCGKQISLGTGVNEKIIDNPLTPTEIHNLIYSSITTTNPCDAVLQQEIALYIGRLISTRPDYFDGILTIRVINFMSAMRSYLNIKTNEIKAKRLRTCRRQATPPKQQHQSQQATNNSNNNPHDDQESSQDSQLGLLDLRLRPSPSPTESASFHLGDDLGEWQQENNNNLNSTPTNTIPGPSQSYTTTNIPEIKVVQPTPNCCPLDPRSQHSHYATMEAGCSKSLGSEQSHSRLRRSRRRYVNSSSNNLVARPLESLSPSDVRKLLVKVLNEVDSLSISDRRQITGELCRVPKDFYDKVWTLLGCTNVGIVIGGKILRSIPTLANMTQDDLNFALKVELLLGEIQCPKLRQINVELLMALHIIVQRNPEIRFDSDPLDLDKIIKLSLEKFRSDYRREDYGLQEYYTHSVQTTKLYTTRAVFDCLLPERLKEQRDVDC